MAIRVDLHTHTTASDGSLAPRELVRVACEAGLTVIAVTDHDTVAGIPPALEAAAGTGLRVLPGLELSATHDGRGVHLLAYGFDLHAPGLVARLSALSGKRAERGRAMIDILAGLGAPLSWERVQEIGRGTIGRPHIARALVEAGHARDIADAFRRFIGEGRPAYLPSSRLTVQEAVEIVRAAGGQVALAHALLPGRPLDVETLAPSLRAAGLSGIEVYHSEHTAEAAVRLRRLAADEELWWCGGSDFHGPDKPRALLGSVAVPPAVLEQGPFLV